MELFLASAFLISLYIIMTFINVWCMAAMLWLVFDRAFYEQYTIRRAKIEMEMRKRSMKIIQGGKE